MSDTQIIQTLMIHTIQGNKAIDDITSRDLVYEYSTGAELYVRGVRDFIEEDIYKLTFNDGRSELYRASECFPNSTVYISINDILQLMAKNNLSLSDKIDRLALGFRPNHFIPGYANKPEYQIKRSNPIAYIAGALLMFGDFNSQYVNIPNDASSVIDTICNKHHVDIHSLDNNCILFKYKNNPNPIKWTEFFSTSVMNFINMKTDEIPTEYLMSNELDRIQFIRGVFDANGNIPERGVYPYILNTSENKLKSLQTMIWSIGALSVISQCLNSSKYQLTLFCDINKVPDWFYDISKKLEIVSNTPNYINQASDMKTFISTIEFYGHEKTKGLITDFVGSLYLTGEFIPKFSV